MGSFIVKGAYQLVPDKMAVSAAEPDPPAGDVYYGNELESSCLYESDFAYYKPRADLLLAGKCHTPRKKPLPACEVTFQVGEKTKSLAVFGNRYWEKKFGTVSVISEPEPFTEMDLVYENSFGGPDCASNPFGKGSLDILLKSGQKVRPLPNIEMRGQLIASPADRVAPAGFGPLGRMWKQRMEKVGTYDEKWLKEKWPFFPDDFDWGYFNSAPPDMQVDGYLHGDEALFLKNMHPANRRYAAQLPCERARCFLHRSDNTTGPEFTEVHLNLDTLWLDMETEKLVLVWRGCEKVATEGLEEFDACLIAREPLSENNSADDYFNLLQACIRAESEEKRQSLDERIKVYDAGWEKDFEATFEKMEADFKSLEKEVAAQEASAKAILVDLRLDPEFLNMQKNGTSPMNIKEILARSERHLQSLREAEPGIADALPPPMTPEEMDEIESAFQIEPLPEAEPFPEPLTREDVEQMVRRQESLMDQDLGGLDLSSINLENMDCRNTRFESALLVNANLSGADLSAANFHGCDLSGTDLSHARLANADLSEAILAGAKLDNADLGNADFSEALLEKASLIKVSGFRAIFVGCNLKGAAGREGIFEEADLEAAFLEGADFSRAVFKEASVEKARGIGINMAYADLTGLHAGDGPDFQNGNFRGSKADESIWEGANLDGCDFSEASLNMADFTSASLKNAVFSRADLKMSKFINADLSGTVMHFVNLFKGSFEKATLQSTDLRGSNLYEVEFYETRMDDTVNFQGCNLKMSKLDKNVFL